MNLEPLYNKKNNVTLNIFIIYDLRLNTKKSDEQKFNFNNSVLISFV